VKRLVLRVVQNTEKTWTITLEDEGILDGWIGKCRRAGHGYSTFSDSTNWGTLPSHYSYPSLGSVMVVSFDYAGAYIGCVGNL